MKSFGPLYVDTIKLKHPLLPLAEWGWSQETEPPYRESAVCVVLWLPFIPRGIAIGIWGKAVREEDAMYKIVRFGRRDAFEIKTEDIRNYQRLDSEDGW